MTTLNLVRWDVFALIGPRTPAKVRKRHEETCNAEMFFRGECPIQDAASNEQICTADPFLATDPWSSALAVHNKSEQKKGRLDQIDEEFCGLALIAGKALDGGTRPRQT